MESAYILGESLLALIIPVCSLKKIFKYQICSIASNKTPLYF